MERRHLAVGDQRGELEDISERCRIPEG
jgi:hypothetical protein